MKAYSLIDCSSDYFSMGIYTSLENLYVALRDCVKKDLEYSSKENIKGWYKIMKVYLDNEPCLSYEFSSNGIEIPIDWSKIFDDEEREAAEVDMIYKVKMYINQLIADATNVPKQALNFRAQAYGALMFVFNTLEFADPQKAKLVSFWDKAYETFNKIYNERS